MSKKNVNTTETTVSIQRYVETKNGEKIRVRKHLKPNPDGSLTTKEKILKPNTWKFLNKVKTRTVVIRWENE